MSEDFDKLKARKDMLVQRERETVRSVSPDADTLAYCGCGDGFTTTNPGTCVNCLASLTAPDAGEVARRAAEKIWEKFRVYDPGAAINEMQIDIFAGIIQSELANVGTPDADEPQDSGTATKGHS